MELGQAVQNHGEGWDAEDAWSAHENEWSQPREVANDLNMILPGDLQHNYPVKDTMISNQNQTTSESHYVHDEPTPELLKDQQPQSISGPTEASTNTQFLIKSRSEEEVIRASDKSLAESEIGAINTESSESKIRCADKQIDRDITSPVSTSRVPHSSISVPQSTPQNLAVEHSELSSLLEEKDKKITLLSQEGTNSILLPFRKHLILHLGEFLAREIRSLTKILQQAERDTSELQTNVTKLNHVAVSERKKMEVLERRYRDSQGTFC
jgi:hypothetical protein